MSLETNSELDQANLRIVVASIAIVYISVLGFLPGQSVDTYLPVILYIFLFLLASIVLRQVIVRWPGHYPARRIFGRSEERRVGKECRSRCAPYH